MSLNERVRKRISGNLEDIKYAKRKWRFRRHVDSSFETETVKDTFIQIQNLAVFLFEHEAALKALGANGADFELLDTVIYPVSENVYGNVDYKSDSETDELIVGVLLSTKKEKTKLGIVSRMEIRGNEVASVFVTIRGCDDEEKKYVDEGFICAIVNKEDLEKEKPGESECKHSTIWIGSDCKRVHVIPRRGSEFSKMDFTYIGELDGKGVLVNIIRKNKNLPSGGGGRKKELDQDFSPELNFGRVI